MKSHKNNIVTFVFQLATSDPLILRSLLTATLSETFNFNMTYRQISQQYSLKFQQDKGVSKMKRNSFLIRRGKLRTKSLNLFWTKKEKMAMSAF